MTVDLERLEKLVGLIDGQRTGALTIASVFHYCNDVELEVLCARTLLCGSERMGTLDTSVYTSETDQDEFLMFLQFYLFVIFVIQFVTHLQPSCYEN